MSGWHPNVKDGGIPPNPAMPTSPAQAFQPMVPPVDTDALYYGNGCDVRLRPHVLNSLMSEGLALIDRVGLAYRSARLTNLRMGVEYMIQKGKPRYVVLEPQASPAHMYFGILDPPVLNGLNEGMAIIVLPTSRNRGLVRIDVGNGAWLPVLRNDGEELEEDDWPGNIPHPICYHDGKWYMLGPCHSQLFVAQQHPLISIKLLDTPGSWLYTPTEGTRAVVVFCTAGGGAGGCSGWANGDGGNAGGTAIEYVDITGIPNIPYTIGRGGARQPVYGKNGPPGAPSNFGTYAVATGGDGGHGSDDTKPPIFPGIGTVGLMKLRGGPGQPATGGDQPGMGGYSFWGGAGAAGHARFNPYIPAMDGLVGGGGGANGLPGGPNRPGMAGGDGIIVLFELP